MESHDLRNQLTIKSQKAEAYFFRMAKDIVYSASMLDPDLNSQKKMIALYHSLEELLYSH